MRFYVGCQIAVILLVADLLPAFAAEPHRPELQDYEAPVWGGRLPAGAYVQGTHTYALVRIRAKAPYSDSLIVARFERRSERPRPTAFCKTDLDTVSSDPAEGYAWRLAYGVLWGIDGRGVHRVPLDDWSLHDPANPNRLEESKRKYPKEGLHWGDLSAQSWLFRSADFGRFYKLVHGRNQEWYQRKFESLTGLQRLHNTVGLNPNAWNNVFRQGVHVDLLPESTTSTLIFCAPHWHIVPGNVVVDAWSLNAKWNSEKREWEQIENSKTPLFTIELPFDEPFRVFGNRKELFFVTQGGALYSAFRTDDGKYKVEQRWKGTRYPIVALVNDTKRHRTFAFTKTVVRRDNDQPYYFELRVPLKPVQYDFPASDKVDATTLAELTGLLMGKEIDVERK